eukprot:213674-Chlamydomonas_euryale.AAC.2
MHEGPVLAFTLTRNLGRVILEQTMPVLASGLGLSCLPRPSLGLGHACTYMPLGLRPPGIYMHASSRPRAAASASGGVIALDLRPR